MKLYISGGVFVLNLDDILKEFLFDCEVKNYAKRAFF